MTSVLEQAWTDLELIVVDDGSTDQTQSLLAAQNDPRLTGMHQENKGVSAARNLGIRASRGHFIALLDSDDFWLPTKLSRQMAFMQESGLAISQTGEHWVRDGVRVNAGHKHAKRAGWFLKESLEMCLISPSCVLFTRALWEELGPFDESLPACEDYALWLRVCARHAVGLVPEALTVKTGGHADQLSRCIIGLDLYRIRAMCALLESMPLTAEEQIWTRQALRRRVGMYALGCMKNGQVDEAARVWDMTRPFLDGGEG